VYSHFQAERKWKVRAVIRIDYDPDDPTEGLEAFHWDVWVPLEQALPANAVVTLVVGTDDDEDEAARILRERWVRRLYDRAHRSEPKGEQGMNQPATNQPVLVWASESLDGRCGLEIYAPSAEAADAVQKVDGIFVAPGFAAEVRDEVAGRKIVVLTPFANTTTVWGDDLAPESSADEVLSMDLQHRQVTVCNCEPGAQLLDKRWWDADRVLVIDAAGRLRTG
jgi:hypothetical protein